LLKKFPVSYSHRRLFQLSGYPQSPISDKEKCNRFGAKNIKFVIPQYPFIDSEGKNRRIDFVLIYNDKKIALEVNGETYHGEDIIPRERFDDNLI